MKQQAMGHKVCVITSQYVPSARFFGSAVGDRNVGVGQFLEEGILTYRLPCLFELEGTTIIMRGIGKMLRVFEPDVVHCHDLISPTFVNAAFHKKSLNYALSVDSITGTYNPTNLKKIAFLLYKNLAFKYASKKVDKFFAISNGSQKWLMEELNVSACDITLAPLGADMQLFTRDFTKRIAIRHLLDFSDDNVVIIYTGKILPEKDITILISALAVLPLESKSKIKLLIIGNGPRDYVDKINSLAKKNDLCENVDIRPPVYRKLLPEFYSAADIAVWPGSPSNSIIEAMSTGLPIIIAGYRPPRHDAYDTSKLLEYDNGLSFLRGNIGELSSCLEKLANDGKLRLDMGSRSRKLVEEKLNWDKIAKDTVNSYYAALSGKKEK